MAQGQPPITVVGVGSSPIGELARDRLRGAALVVGGRRQLAAAGALEAPRLVELGGDLEPAFEAIAASAEPVVVLASGDPGFFGIVRALAARFGRRRLEVLPALSAVAAAFAAAGLPWDDAVVVSAHGRDPRSAVNVCLAHPKVAVLTQPGFGPAELAIELRDLDRRLLVAERLGEPGERVVEDDPAGVAAGHWADPNVVLVLDETAAAARNRATTWPARRMPTRWALPESAFEHRDGMITKAEVRALALARLGPGLGDLLWDVGAGSGSVGVECARLGAAVVAVDREPAACALVARNAARHGVHVRVVEGAAPAALAGLPAPDAVFVGGGGGALPDILQVVGGRARRVVVVALSGSARLVSADRVVGAAHALAAAGLEVDTVRLQAGRFETDGCLQESRAVNPVFLVTGVRGAQGRDTAVAEGRLARPSGSPPMDQGVRGAQGLDPAVAEGRLARPSGSPPVDRGVRA
jgi:precorrin-6Y C5,15-methyltransferase (decarboxylating)